ncbi:hypothetical protein AOLI_G00026460 [Acnodon oligacanthus]
MTLKRTRLPSENTGEGTNPRQPAESGRQRQEKDRLNGRARQETATALARNSRMCLSGLDRWNRCCTSNDKSFICRIGQDLRS